MEIVANLGDTSFCWTSSPRPDITLELSQDTACSFNQLLKILTDTQVEVITPAYSKMSECFVSSSLFAPLLIPKHVLKSSIEHAEKTINEALSTESDIEYSVGWKKIHQFLNSMQPAKIDENALKFFIESQNAEAKRSFASFMPSSSGYAKKVIYSTSDSLTGRIKVISGPQILTVPQEVRKCIRSSYDDGKIIMIDFMSVEPRIALITVGKEAPEDVYGDLLEEFPEIGRQAAKLATLIALYGGKVNRLCDVVKDPSIARKSVDFVKSHFRVDNLERMLSEQAESGLVRNAIGRPLREATKNPRIRTNHYLQSSAAEISSLLFAELCASFGRSLKPLFVIHDALIVDIKKCDVPDFISLSNSILWKGSKMPVKIEELSPT